MKTILYHSNSSKAFTGFGKNIKNILKYLHKTKKYEVINLQMVNIGAIQVYN